MEFKQVDFSLKWIWPFFEVKQNENEKKWNWQKRLLAIVQLTRNKPSLFFLSSSSSLFLFLALNNYFIESSIWSHNFLGVSVMLNVGQQLSWNQKADMWICKGGREIVVVQITSITTLVEAIWGIWGTIWGERTYLCSAVGDANVIWHQYFLFSIISYLLSTFWIF